MNRRTLILKLLPDVALPAAIYFLLRMLDQSTTVALLAAGGYSACRVGWVAVARHRITVIGLMVSVGVLIGAGLTMITGDARYLMARDSIVSGALGLILLGSLVLRRPVLFPLLKSMSSDDPAKVARLDQLMTGDPAFRRRLTMITAVWGAGALLESVVRVALVYLLPLDVMPVVSVVLQLVTFGLLLGWTVRYRTKRVRSAAEAKREQEPAL